MSHSFCLHLDASGLCLCLLVALPARTQHHQVMLRADGARQAFIAGMRHLNTQISCHGLSTLSFIAEMCGLMCEFMNARSSCRIVAIACRLRRLRSCPCALNVIISCNTALCHFPKPTPYAMHMIEIHKTKADCPLGGCSHLVSRPCMSIIMYLYHAAIAAAVPGRAGGVHQSEGGVHQSDAMQVWRAREAGLAALPHLKAAAISSARV